MFTRNAVALLVAEVARIAAGALSGDEASLSSAGGSRRGSLGSLDSEPGSVGPSDGRAPPEKAAVAAAKVAAAANGIVGVDAEDTSGADADASAPA